ncbi:SigE family RNA polymerase sigma factor [Pengzhenrongella phosphoraccumulans]|uniref:SigE family RNA polymerase sigma factor n=1 Tax=Pengzhenrongella phosphoraccumulans TaxID=3114394 RepID=UPI00388E242C
MSTVVGAASQDSAAIPCVRPAQDAAAAETARRHDDVADRGAPPGPAGLGLDDVVRAHLPGLLRYATILTGDGNTAADLVQEVLLRAHIRWTRIGMMARPDLYLRRMVTNEHLSWRRRWHVRNVRPEADATLALRIDPQRDHAQHVVEDDAMWRQLATLPARQRAVLVLRYYEGLSDPEIASVLGTSGATVRSHASRALATLRHTDPSTPMEQP